ncbi:STAS domain-containing protein [Antrihabitans sp. YC2-6]|uniref:STAS domain-containing protein n=1 Tax=Antrihabitans sp. YC2-6 TaxID=2799498 RepID=UPI0018F4211D|nr:STAS domain-containing protein [Antrihabitans sp. YC2-6]MBJ8347110.1 STAS domain-containing protein [Antrihabitans sp. YC2-6]
MSVRIGRVSANSLDVIALQGDLDLESCPEVLKKVGDRALAGRHLKIDLSGVDLFGAAAMALVQTLHDQAVAAGGSCCLVAVPPRIIRVMAIVGFEDIVPVRNGPNESPEPAVDESVA